jgi:hypothetical protein
MRVRWGQSLHLQGTNTRHPASPGIGLQYKAQFMISYQIITDPVDDRHATDFVRTKFFQHEIQIHTKILELSVEASISATVAENYIQCLEHNKLNKLFKNTELCNSVDTLMKY